MLPLNGWSSRRISPFRDDEIHGLGTRRFHIGASGVEVSVVGDHFPGATHCAKENPLCCASLVCGNDVCKRKEHSHRVTEDEPRRGASIGLVSSSEWPPIGRATSRRCRSQSAGR